MCFGGVKRRSVRVQTHPDTRARVACRQGSLRSPDPSTSLPVHRRDTPGHRAPSRCLCHVVM